MTDLINLRLSQHVNVMAHEMYRHQLLHNLPDPYPSMLPVPPPSCHISMAPRYLPDVEAKLQNKELWSEFHHIGTEMIITKSGRRMFPSMRLSLTGLEDDVNYCVLLEMVPIGDCRYKFSGSQWVPAGGAEPQSPHRIYLHQDSPALGSHWKTQPIIFNKVKLTNNTLDNNGHIVLTSMHKYQPRIHIIQASDPSQIPWSPQSSFTFNETSFVAVTAYQNDRITKLKIDNNPFAKGFRETGQSRCKRKNTSATKTSTSSVSSTSSTSSSTSTHEETTCEHNLEPEVKRLRPDSSACSISSLDDSALSLSESCSGTSSPIVTEELSLIKQIEDDRLRDVYTNDTIFKQYNNFLNPWMDLAFSYFSRPSYSYYPSIPIQDTSYSYANMQLSSIPYASISPPMFNTSFHPSSPKGFTKFNNTKPSDNLIINKPTKKASFTISDILGTG